MNPVSTDALQHTISVKTVDGMDTFVLSETDRLAYVETFSGKGFSDVKLVNRVLDSGALAIGLQVRTDPGPEQDERFFVFFNLSAAYWQVAGDVFAKVATQEEGNRTIHLPGLALESDQT